MLPPDFDALSEQLGSIAPVEPLELAPAFSFALVFNQVFLNTRGFYEPAPDEAGAPPGAGNWAYHAALAFAQAGEVLGLRCRFPAGRLGTGRHGAAGHEVIVETRAHPPRQILVGEWGWDYGEVFGRGKELERLSGHCHADQCVDGLLLVHCPPPVYRVFATNVAETWLELTRSRSRPPSLYLHCLLSPMPLLAEALACLRTLVIHPARIQLWPDQWLGNS